MTSYTTGMMTTVDKLRQKKTKTTKSETMTIGEKRKKMQSGNRKKIILDQNTQFQQFFLLVYRGFHPFIMNSFFHLQPE